MTEIRKFHQNAKFSKYKMSRRLHLGFTKMLTTSAWIELMAEFELHIPWHTKIGKCQCEIFENERWRPEAK